MLRLLRHYFYFVPAQLSKAKGIGKNILLKLQLVIRIFNCFSSPSCYFRHIIILGLLKNN
ncbi:hypothetical protein BANRA_04354 [Escherichia coli]|nr:hypothetical protein BANRA_04354 [Escherichia coli]